VEQVERCVREGLIEVGYALVDEAGYWRTRRNPPRGECRVWGMDTQRRMAPALYVARASAAPDRD
jgi:hypothetical protein